MKTTVTKTNYLVTDPCYISEGQVYRELLDWYEGVSPYSETFSIPGFGTVLECEHLGELSVKVGKNKEFMSDSGLICLVELNEGVIPTEYNGTAITAKKEVAEKWFQKGRNIAEGFWR